METYKVARWRFTWRNRTIPRGNGRVRVLGRTKNQRTDAVSGRCKYYSLCKVLEDHIRLKFNIDVKVSISELEREGRSIVTDKNKDNIVWMTCDFLKQTGATALCFEGLPNETTVRFKLKAYHPLKLKIQDSKGLSFSVGKYMTQGPMVGVFAIHGDDMERYGRTNPPLPDEIYFVSKDKPKRATHCVSLPGFGFVSTFPFWHFENTYGEGWRGPARGFGQLYAPHLKELYGVELEDSAPF